MTDWTEDEMRAQLSDRARAFYDNYDTRRHGVDLERVQRIHLGIDDEEMEFSTKTLAAMLQEVADRCDEDEAFTIHAIVNALLGKDDDHELILKQKRRGKYVNPTAHGAKHWRELSWLHTLANREKAGVKTESAVAEICAREKLSRAAVFAGIKAAEDYLASGRKIFPETPNFDNPRPAKSQKS